MAVARAAAVFARCERTMPTAGAMRNWFFAASALLTISTAAAARQVVPRGFAAVLRVALLVSGGVGWGCAPVEPAQVVRTLTGEWGLSVAASPSCQGTLPFGYGVAPRGGGRASLVQTGNILSGVLYISGTPSGAINGTVGDGRIDFSFTLDGRNVGVLKPEDEPCRVTGTATGATDGYCWASVKISGDFACPYACTAADHILVFDRGRTCR